MDKLDKKYYRIADVADMTGVPMSTLRFWEKEFTSIRPKRTPTGQRLYTPTDIEKINIIRFLIRDKGMTIEGARQHLAGIRSNTDRIHSAITRLQAVRKELTSLIEALDARQRILKKNKQ